MRDRTIELVPGRLYALGSMVALDGRVSWVPPDARGYQALNCYLLLEGHKALLIDTGVAAHERQIIEQLSGTLPSGAELSIFVTRPELDAVGNVLAIASHFPVKVAYAGGFGNPFDGMDQITSLGSSTYLPNIERRSYLQPVELGPSRQLEILTVPTRMVTCFWVYDSATQTLFTADSFGHHTSTARDYLPILSEDSDLMSQDSFSKFTKARYWWLDGSRTNELVANLTAIFAERNVDRIAPTYGCIVSGRAQVEKYFQMMKRLLEEAGSEHSVRPQ